VLVALRHFRRHLPGSLIIVADHRVGSLECTSGHASVAIHRSRSSDPHLYQEWLPPYAPDLNPEEACHGNLKQHLRNATPATMEELRDQVHRGFARLRQRPDTKLLSSCRPHRCGLTYLNINSSRSVLKSSTYTHTCIA
jgi:transposase